MVLREENLIKNLEAVKDNIKNAAAEYNIFHPSNFTELIAVSKTFPARDIEVLLEHGHRVFGENKVQEALEKWLPLKQKYPQSTLHMIGPLQTNKVKDALKIFDVIETVDRKKLANMLAKYIKETDKKVECFIQVNTGEEPQKAGILPSEADEFIRYCVAEISLPIRGLMCIPPADEEPSVHFALLSHIAKRNGLVDLSMGMSRDYELAAAMGARYVRVGSAIFGSRSQAE